MTRDAWKNKSKIRYVSTTITFGECLSQVHVANITKIGDVYVDADDFTCYFDVHTTDGQTTRFERDLEPRTKTKRFIKKTITLFGKKYKRIKTEVEYDPQDYFDNPTPNLEAVLRNHKVAKRYVSSYARANV